MFCDIFSCKKYIILGICASFALYLSIYLLIYLYSIYYVFRYDSNDLNEWKKEENQNIDQSINNQINSINK